MDFSEAYKHMQNRHIVSRPCWAPGFGLCIYMGELWYTMRGCLYERAHKLDEENLLAGDWKKKGTI